jgi:hypothetical protein
VVPAGAPEDSAAAVPGGGNMRIPVSTPLLSLIAANVVTIVLALVEHWDLGAVLFIYWFQSVTIGLFTAFSILSLDSGELTGLVAAHAAGAGANLGEMGGVIGYGKFLMAGFFALHYGLFHWGYLTFLADFGLIEGRIFEPAVLLACGLFVANHAYSFLHHRHAERLTDDYVKELFVAPYYRIVPMHLTIMVGGFATILLGIAGIDATIWVLVFFLVAKTYTDVRMHLYKHAGKGIDPFRSLGFG